MTPHCKYGAFFTQRAFFLPNKFHVYPEFPDHTLFSPISHHNFCLLCSRTLAGHTQAKLNNFWGGGEFGVRKKDPFGKKV